MNLRFDTIRGLTAAFHNNVCHGGVTKINERKFEARWRNSSDTFETLPRAKKFIKRMIERELAETPT